MNRTFIKLYDCTLGEGLSLEERVVHGLIAQFCETGIGFYGGYKLMSDRTGIPKSRCKTLCESLKKKGYIEESRAVVKGVTRILLTAYLP